MKISKVHTLMILLFALALPSPSFSDSFTITSGVDVAPYEFLPSSNRGNYTTLYAFDESNGHDFETYIRFQLPENLLPEGHVVTQAIFFIAYAFDYTAFGETSNEPGTVIVYRVDENWGENSLTWNDRPAATMALDQMDNIVDFGALVFDVTGLTQEWLEGSRLNYGIALKSTTARVIGMHSFESSADGSLKATLLIETEASNAVPTFGPVALAVLTMLMATVGAVQLRERT